MRIKMSVSFLLVKELSTHTSTRPYTTQVAVASWIDNLIASEFCEYYQINH